MSIIDWAILIVLLIAIILYGLYKSNAPKNIEGYFLNNKSMPWYLILLGIMGTQASAVTFLTGPGQAYTDGLRFVQYYFGLPLAMLVIAFVFVPAYTKLNITTAYEFLEKRFDGRTRTLTSILFLVSRGLSTGVSIYAPSIVLSTLFHFNIYITNMVVGGLLIIYTVTGGAKAVAHTQKIQMLLVFAVLILLFYFGISITQQGGFSAIAEAGKGLGKMNVITTGFKTNGDFDWKDKYNIFSGIIGGFFLALSYFGTDHSQVGRYISGKDTKEIKTGLLLNGLVKVPMQYVILLLGVFAFVFYLGKAPIYFNQYQKEKAYTTLYKDSLVKTEQQYNLALANGNVVVQSDLRKEYKRILEKALPKQDVGDTNYIYLQYVMQQMPKGLIGLFIAILILSAWGSISAALNALAACSVLDIHKKYFSKNNTAAEDYTLSKMHSLFWGVFCVIVAMFASNIGNSLIETVNIIGSLFYGVILGIFLIALFVKNITAKATFWAAVASQVAICVIYYLDLVSFLWLNVIGALLVLSIAQLLQLGLASKKDKVRIEA